MRRIREVLLTVGAVLGAVCLLLGLVAVTVGVHVLVFRSGSMSPTIDTGDLALTRTVSASELRTDDVVSVLDAGGNRVTHRLVGVAEQGDQRQLTLQGDANEQPDSEIYTVTEAQRVVFVVPKAGYLVGWSTGPAGLLLLGAYGAFLVTVLLRRKDDDEGGPTPPRRRAAGKRRAPRRAPATVVAMTAVALTGAGVAVPGTASAAAWTDSVAVDGGVFTGTSALQVDSVTCTGGGLGSSLTFKWPNKDLRYSYVVQIEKPAGTVVSSSTVLNNGTVGSDQTHVLSLGLLGGLLGVSSTFTVRVRSQFAGTNWITASGPTDTGTFTLGILTNC